MNLLKSNRLKLLSIKTWKKFKLFSTVEGMVFLSLTRNSLWKVQCGILDPKQGAKITWKDFVSIYHHWATPSETIKHWKKTWTTPTDLIRSVRTSEQHLRIKLPKAISKCQGRYGKAISATYTLIVRSVSTRSWADRNTGENRRSISHYTYISRKNVWKILTVEKFYGLRESFNFKSITVDNDTPDSLKASEKVFLTQLRVTCL